MVKANDLTKQIASILFEGLQGSESDLPRDEYETEAGEILKRLHALETVNSNAATEVLVDVLSHSFDDSFREEEFSGIAHQITELLVK